MGAIYVASQQTWGHFEGLRSAHAARSLHLLLVLTVESELYKTSLAPSGCIKQRYDAA
jgi:hypothetical protein